MGPDAILYAKRHKKFGSHNGSLTQSIYHSENTKIKGFLTVCALYAQFSED